MGWFETLHIAVGYNTTDPNAERNQQGGVALFSMDTMAHRIIETGQDETGLGRWTWQRYRGKANHTVRIIVGYRPCLNRTLSGSVYSQHRKYFQDKEIDACPRKLFLDDLCADIVNWMATGDKIIFMGDLNEDVRSADIQNRFKSLDMHEGILDMHGSNAPATFDGGSKPIEGVWVSKGLQLTKAGYMAFGQCPFGSHRCLWIEFQKSDALGQDLHQIVSPPSKTTQMQRSPHCQEVQLGI